MPRHVIRTYSWDTDARHPVPWAGQTYVRPRSAVRAAERLVREVPGLVVRIVHLRHGAIVLRSDRAGNLLPIDVEGDRRFWEPHVPDPDVAEPVA